MINDARQAEKEIKAQLKSRGLAVAPGAMRPLARIDFGKMVAIYDHEEQFLRQVFVDSLVRAHAARIGKSRSAPVEVQDVRTAMLMLGAAVDAAPDEKFSKQSGSIIHSICPYCP